MSKDSSRTTKSQRTRKAILDAQLKAWDAVVKKRSAENPLFAKVVESQKAWVKRVVAFDLEYEVSQSVSFNHYFGA